MCIRDRSKPGLRIYTNCEDMPKVMKGLGTAIISTSKGNVREKQSEYASQLKDCLLYTSYKGKGIRYAGEVVKHKEGKAGKGKK